MGDVLSQNQIDELLNSFNSEGSKAFEEIEEVINTKKIKVYDFKTPKKFTKDQIRIIGDIYESYTRLLSSYLTSMTRLYSKARVIQIDEQRYFEFSNALPDYVILGNINLDADDEEIVETTCVIQISNTITFLLIERLLGGFGSAFDISRDFTEIETSLMKGVLEKMAGFLKEAWMNYLEINTSLEGIDTNARVSQAISPDDVVIMVTIEVEIKDIKNIITISIPAVNMEAIMSKFNTQHSKNVKKFDAVKDAERRDEILKGLKNSSLKLDIILAETEVELYDILTLKVNDVIPLQVPITHNASVKINDNLWFDGKLGTKNHKKAIKIDNIYKT